MVVDKMASAKGGRNRALRMPSEERVAAARKAALARWSKRDKPAVPLAAAIAAIQAVLVERQAGPQTVRNWEWVVQYLKQEVP